MILVNKVLLTAMHVKNAHFNTRLDILEEHKHKYYVEIGHKAVHLLPTNPEKGNWVFNTEEQLDKLCEDAFYWFNWQDSRHSGHAPLEVNTICRFNDTHASMSVGDVVKIQYMKPPTGNNLEKVITRYFKCESMGFKEIWK